VPQQYFDPARHKFRTASFAENMINLAAIHTIIKQHRPEARIVFTLSPIPLTATFRPIPCMVADSASKGVLRAALDELVTSTCDPALYYFPSYEIVTRLFAAPYMEDRRHVHKHILDFNMKLFERYYCRTALSDADILSQFRAARSQDRKVYAEGHWAVPRAHLAYHKPVEKAPE
jgi:hypothetical protein